MSPVFGAEVRGETRSCLVSNSLPKTSSCPPEPHWEWGGEALGDANDCWLFINKTMSSLTPAVEMFKTLKRRKIGSQVFVDILTPCFTGQSTFPKACGTTPGWPPVEVSKTLRELGPYSVLGWRMLIVQGWAGAGFDEMCMQSLGPVRNKAIFQSVYFAPNRPQPTLNFRRTRTTPFGDHGAAVSLLGKTWGRNMVRSKEWGHLEPSSWVQNRLVR